jgi:hypothetical protein
MEEFPRNLSEFEAWFATEQECRHYLFRLRWPEGFRVTVTFLVDLIAFFENIKFVNS